MNDEERIKKMSRAHAEAMLKVSELLAEEEISSLKDFLVNLKPAYRRRIEPTKNFQKISAVLLSGGLIKQGEYTFLKDYFHKFGRLDYVDVLSEAEQEITRLSESRKPGTKVMADPKPSTSGLKRKSSFSQDTTDDRERIKHRCEGTQDREEDQTLTDARAKESTRAEEENRSKIEQYHADLAVELDRIITPEQFRKLKFYFKQKMNEDKEMEELNGFDEMWEELKRRGEIIPGKYGILEEALQSIQATSHLQIIKEFQEKMKSEDGRSEEWIRDPHAVNTREDVTRLKEMYRSRLEDQEYGCPGVLFKNAAVSNIGHEGGMLRLLNGSAKLDVPPEAVNRKHLFWMFVDQYGCPQFSMKSANGLVTNSDGIGKYSIPVHLGPSDVHFEIAVRLTVKEFSKPHSANDSPMSVYSKVDGENEWKLAGSCFYDANFNKNLTLSFSLNTFSSYVIGMPVSADLLPLNVRVMVASRRVKADAENAGNELQVFFTVNDYSFSQELVLHNWINVDGATCLYLDPKHDVSVTWVRRHSVQTSVKYSKKEILHKEHIQNLAETPVSLEVAAIDHSDTADIIETESEFEDILILEQNGTELVELPFTRSASAVTTSAEQPTDCPKETNQVTDLSKHLIRATLSGNKNEVQRLLNEGANIETRDEDGNTLMSLASNRGHTDIVQLLLEAMNDEERMDEISGVHARTMWKVSQSLTEEETSSFKTFLVNLKPDYTKRIEPTKDFQKISGVLISGGNIKPGKYTFLKDLFDRFGRLDLVDVLSDAEREIAKQKENNSKILLHHADLAVELKRTITPSQLETLILVFREMYSGGEMDEINSFNDMWKVLMRQGDISPGRYGILERALRSIQATSHLQILNDFNEKIKNEDGRYER